LWTRGVRICRRRRRRNKACGVSKSRSLGDLKSPRDDKRLRGTKPRRNDSDRSGGPRSTRSARSGSRRSAQTPRNRLDFDSDAPPFGACSLKMTILKRRVTIHRAKARCATRVFHCSCTFTLSLPSPVTSTGVPLFR
jgi:hypothetical protein